MGLSRMTKRCRECPFKDTCENKKIEAVAYFTDSMISPASGFASMDATAEMMIKHDYREIYIDKNTRVTIDLEEIKRQMERDFYKSLGIGLMLGGA